jgi:hypothetical protein
LSDWDCDVLIVGGGVTGVGTAIAAARTGARTVLIEARPFVGGNAATGLCIHSYFTRFGEQVVFGLAQELVDRCTEIGGAVGHVPYDGYVQTVTPVDGDLFRVVATKALAEAGVTVLYGGTLVGAETSDGHIHDVEVALKGQLRRMRAKVFVDTSGDADLVALGGGEYRKGQPLKGGGVGMQPVSMMFTCRNTDNIRAAEEIAVSKPAMASRSDHPTPFPVYFNGSLERWKDELREATSVFDNHKEQIWVNSVWPDQLNVNTTVVVGIDGTDPLAMSRATVELTDQVAAIGAFLRKHVPGFEHSRAIPAAFVGVRETRNIVGIAECDDQDVAEGRKHADGIGRSSFPSDIHDPVTGDTVHTDIGGDGSFDIRYGALVPRALDNVLVAGRCISATPFAHGSTRNMAQCLVTGEAAGVAAAMCAAEGTDPRLLAVGRLQEELKSRGAFIG